MKSSLRSVSRWKVQVELRARMSTSPEERAVNRVWPVVGTYLILVESPRTASASALQNETSNPDQYHFSSGAAKPIRPVFTPQFSTPRALTSFSVSPSAASAPEAARATAVTEPKNTDFFIDFPTVVPGPAEE